MPQLSCLTPFDEMTFTEEDGHIVSLDWGRGRDQDRTPLLLAAVAQLQSYFDGALENFDLPLAPHGTDFQKRVWRAMRAIPYGQTLTYQQVSDQLKGSARAVGAACGRNPIPIVIPCHRILARKGLGGYSGDGGLETKAALLRLEGVLL